MFYCRRGNVDVGSKLLRGELSNQKDSELGKTKRARRAEGLLA